MKKTTIYILLVGMFAIQSPSVNAQIPVVSLISGIIKKVITGIDLKVQRLQNQTIALQNVEKQAENTLHVNSLTGISGWLNKEKTLYQDYYGDLAKVKTIISNYDEVRRIITQQVQLVGEYEGAYTLAKKDGHFSADELSYMSNIYSGILQESVRNLDEALLAVNSFSTQMTDGERLEMVHGAAINLQKNLNDLRQFNIRTRTLSLARAKDNEDRQAVKALYGIK